MNSSWVVCKFGGSSVASAAHWQSIAAIVKSHLSEGDKVIIVCSALCGVSNALEEAITAAINQSLDLSQSLKEIEVAHLKLCDDLQLTDQSNLLNTELAGLKQRLEGIALLGEASPRVRAQVMAFGELLLTRLAAEFLTAQAITLSWQDARDWLQSIDEPLAKPRRQFLQARCSADPDAQLVEKLNQLKQGVVITQGFIARNASGDTVLLGRGGSDASAAYFSAKLGAKVCEIWTDVPGVYSANPHQIPEARMIKQLNYSEAQEIAAMGGKVLHPNCLGPLKQQGIPLLIKYTQQPNGEGTCVSVSGAKTGSIKSILCRYGVLVISIETVWMWQQVGFLAKVFDCFKQHGLSVDLVSTSESNVTVSLDTQSFDQDSGVINALLHQLNQFAKAKSIGNCASISLVGQNIRSILHKLGGVFSLFEAQEIYLLSQAANDLNLTFVVNADQAQRLAQRLHHLLIEQRASTEVFGRSWLQEFADDKQKEVVPWWQLQREALLNLVAEQQQALYVYNQASVATAAQDLLGLEALSQVFYAMKANPNIEVLRCLHECGVNFECVSLGEVGRVLDLFPDIDKLRILFTPNFAPKSEYERAFSLGIHVNVDSLYPLQHWPEIFKGRKVLLRIDPGQGYGHHKFVCTGGSDSKFGIALSEIETLVALIAEHNIEAIGLHCHSGSGILRAETWQENATVLTQLIEKIPTVKIINVGGGLGIVEKPGQKALDLTLLNESLLKVKAAFSDIELWMEPGRYLVAAAGVLLARVTQVKNKNGIAYVGLETGMNSLIRPALYGSYHEIVNLTRLNDKKDQLAHIVGPICESGDTLGYSRPLPNTCEGDVLLIANTGAYGHCMSSHYNLRSPAKEYFLVTEKVTV